MSFTAPEDTFLDVNDANLRVYGNVHADGLVLGQLEVVTTTSTGSTIQFQHQHTAFTTTSNIEVGTTNHDLFVDTSTSRVGILTNTPTEALHVNGTVKATAFDGDGALLTGIPSSAINGTLSQWTTVAGPKIHYSGGNVGIGIADPLWPLDVVGDINFTGALKYQGSDFVSTPWTIESTPALSYTGGNVGIGAATPTAKLEVTGNAHVSTDLSVGGNLTINTISAAATHSLAAVTALGASTGVTLQLTHATTGLVVTGNVAVDTDTLFVNSADNRVGVGTNLPTKKLHVFGDGQTQYGGVIHASLDNPGEVPFESNAFSMNLGGYGHSIRMDLNTLSLNAYGNVGRYGALKFVVGDGAASGSGQIDAMTLQAGGNVGIGVTDPDAKLEVFQNTLGGTAGNSTNIVKFGGDSGGPGALLLTSERVSTGIDWTTTGLRLQKIVDTTKMGYIQFGDDGNLAGQLIFGKSDATETMRIDGDGNVGIGTTTPVSALEVQVPSDSGLVWGTTITNPYNVATTGQGIGLKLQMDGSATWYGDDKWCGIAGIAEANWSDNVGMAFYTQGAIGSNPGNAPTEKMRIDASGNVGIGTTSPSSQLELYGAGKDLTFKYDTGITRSSAATRDTYYSGLENSIKRVGDRNTFDGSSFTPDTTHEILLGFSDIYHQWSGNDEYYPQHNEMRFKLWSPTSSTVGSLTDVMTLRGNGNVGIGTTNPIPKFAVYGSGTSNFSATSYYLKGSITPIAAAASGWGVSIYGNGDVVAGQAMASNQGALTASDTRIKKNIVDADDSECLEVLRLLRPKKYQYKDEIKRGQEPVWGFIAQEVRETLPYASQLRQEFLPNIYELANVSSSNVITFTDFNTTNLESNATTLIRTVGIDGEDRDIHLAEVIDEHTIRVEEDLTEWIGSVDETGNVVAGGNQLFICGQQVDDFVFLKKDAIWTVATAALQEVDRQLQAEKAKNESLETQVSDLLARVTALENA